MARLGPVWRCIAPDMRGFGGNRSGSPCAMGDYADDAAALATELDQPDALARLIEAFPAATPS